MNLYSLNAVHDTSELFFARAERNASAWTKSKKTDDWFAPRAKAFAIKRDRFLPEWTNMPAAEKARFTLQQSHGR